MARRAAVLIRLLTPLLAAVTALSVVAGCSSIGGDGQKTTSPHTNSKGETTSATPTEPVITAAFATPDQKLLKADRATLTHQGLTVTSLLVNQDMPGLAYSLDIVRGQIVRANHWSDAGALTLTPHVVASSSKTVAIAMSATTPGGTNTALVYYDPQTNHSFASTALIAPAQWDSFVTQVAEHAGDDRERATAQLKEPSFPNGAGPAIGFSAEGDLVVIFGHVDGQTIAPVALAGDEAASLLTQLGTQARASARYPTAATTPDVFTAFDPATVGGTPVTSPAPSSTPASTSSTTPASTPGSTPVPTADHRPQLALGTDCQTKKCVALTFDDGPLPATQDVLDQLNTLKAPATFFMLGTSVDAFPTMVTTVAANGMEIASHNQVHTQMSRTGQGLLTKQVTMSADNLRTLTGQDPLFLRPPYGSRNKNSDAIVGTQGMAVALWSVDTLDWKHSQGSQPAAQSAILSAINSEISNGGVILMHDIHANSRASTTAVVTTLREQGYTLVTMAELAPADYRFGKAFCSSPALSKSCVR